MKLRGFVSILLALSVAGCIPLSLHPFYNDDDLVYDAGLEGVWGEEKENWLFEKAGDTEYKLTITDGENAPVVLSAHLVKLKQYQFLDLQVTELSGISEFSSMLLVPVHGIWQYERDGDTLRLRTLNYEWLQEREEKHQLWAAHEKLDDWFVFTAGPDRLQRFFLKWIKHEKAYSDWEDIARLAPADGASTSGG